MQGLTPKNCQCFIALDLLKLYLLLMSVIVVPFTQLCMYLFALSPLARRQQSDLTVVESK